MASERFVLEPQWDRPEYGPDHNGLCVVDTTTNAVVGCDGGEPEDQTLGRDWFWVVGALNAVDAERAAAIVERGRVHAALYALRADMRSHRDWPMWLDRWVARIDAILTGEGEQ